MKKPIVDFSKPSQQQLNNLLEYYQAGRYVDAEKLSISITQEFPDHPFAWKVLSAVLKQTGRISESLVASQKSVQLEPQDAEAHNNLGVILKELGRLDEAEASYGQALTLKPNYTEAHYNLGNILKELGRLDEAEASYGQALTLKPNYTEVHYNLGNILYEQGRLDEAEASYKKVIALKPDYAKAWNNIFFSLQAIKSQTSSIEEHLLFLDEQVTSKYAQTAKSILSYRLNIGGPSANSSFNEAISILSSADNILIKNPKVPSSKLNTEPTPPKKITALLHFGRSGTGLLHSLIDGHPEVSTLPSIYFSEFFDYFTWKKIITGGWEEMADRFTAIYAVLFDASSSIKIATKSNKFIESIGRKEGMTTVGSERDEVLSVDKKVFIKELKRLMDFHEYLDVFAFFKLVHSAYEVSLQNLKEKKLIFYHIHNPDVYAQLNFLRLAPNTNWLIMVREPIQSCESWIRTSFLDNDYEMIASKIFAMLFDVDQVIFQKNNSIGVRLEDLKEYPKKTIPALCSWLGIKEKDSLYQMTAQGKKWWGDPTSPNFTKDGMNPFGKNSINHKLGSIFSKNDQFILRTLFNPFSVRFKYVEENLEQFKNDLQTIRPMLDQMFDFERKMSQHGKMNTEKFIKSGSYLYLRSGMIERWNTLNKFHTYPNMLTPLNINQF